MKTYKIDPLGKNRPLMLVRGTRLPESFPDSVAEHMAKSLKANCRGVFVTINGEITSSTVSTGVVISKETNEDNNTLVVMTEGFQNESVDWEDSTGKQFRLEHEGQFGGPLYGGTDPYYTGAYKDLRTFVTGAVPYTGQPLVAANAKQWYSYTTPEGVALTFRGCIQAPIKEGTDFVGLKIDSINFLSSDTSPSFKLTLDCDSAVSLGLRNGMNDDSKPFNMITGIGWLQIVATDDFKSHIHEFNEASGNGDSFISFLEAYDGFTYNVDLAGITTQPGGYVSAGNNASFRIHVKSGSALENSIIASASGYAYECLSNDMSGSGDTFQIVEEVSTTLNEEPTVINFTPDNYKGAVVIRFSNVQEGEQLHLDLSSDVDTNGDIYFRSMNTAVLGSKYIGTDEKNFVIDIPRGDDVFAYFGVNYNNAGTITLSRTAAQPEPTKTPGFYSADDQLIKAMTKEEVEQNYSPNNSQADVNEEVKNATKFVWPDGVTSIGQYAFSGCQALTSVTIPEGVTSIGENAFDGCIDLTSVTIPNTVTSIGIAAFNGCSGLTSVTIPSTVTEISISAFNGCTGLTSVTIPEGVTSIGRDAFNICTSLTSVIIPNTVTSIGEGAFSGCSSLTSIEIPEGVTSIGEGTFNGCSALTSVTIPEGVTSIGENAFDGCSALTTVTIPSTVTSIGLFAFRGCTGLNPLTVPNTVTTIGDNAFYHVPKVIYGGSATGSPWGATEVLTEMPKTPGFYSADDKLVKAMTKEEVEQDYTGVNYPATNEAVMNATKFVWPEGVTSIGGNAFINCTSLTEVVIPDGVTTIGSSAFSMCVVLTSVTIPSTVTSIGDSAFSGCSDLTSVMIPNTVTSIEAFTFNGCSSLASIEIPEGVTSIGENAFNGCSELTSVTIPSTVTEIADNAFNNCTSLNPLTVPNTVTTIGSDAFFNVPKVIYGGSASGSPWGATEVVAPILTPGFYSADGQLLMAMTKDEVETAYGVAPSSDHQEIKTATKFVWPEGVTKVGNTVFAGCTALASITIPDTVTSIRVEAFKDCTGLTSVTIPSTVTEIWSGAFNGCTSLNPLTVPNTVTEIGSNAFKNVPKVIYNGSASGSPWGATEVAAS